MATTIITKNGSGAPTADDLSVGELAVDLTNKRLYSKNSSSEVIELGVNTASSLDVTGTVTADGLTVVGETTSSNGTYGTKLTYSNGNQSGIIDTFGNHNLEFRANDDRAMNIAANGDISFYEDTGTTAKFFWDASAESLGIGTSSPNDKVDISGSTGDGYRLTDGTHTGVYRSISGGTILKTTSNHDLLFGTNDTERMRIDASGNVGIGTTSPATELHVNGKILTAGGTASSPALQLNDVNSGLFSAGGNTIAFSTDGVEAMRIDSSGNLLVGTTQTPATLITTSTTSHEGVGIADGFLSIARDLTGSANSGGLLFLNRLATDGPIADFRKDGTSVGSIGTLSGDLTIGTGDTGLGFLDGGNFIQPHNITTNAVRDAAIDLGTTSGRFKDLYLSGGVYVGGTGSANKLDDYEEGTWTPEYTAPSGVATYGVQTGSYTKVGNKVTVIAELQADRNTLSGLIKIGGLPFSSTGTGGGFYPTFAMRFGSDMPNLLGYVSGSEINLRKQATNATGSTTLDETDLSTAGTAYNYLYFTATYFT